jgi:hypothetical protein
MKWICEPDEGIYDAMNKDLPENDRIEMGKRGQELIQNNYSVEVVSKKMIQLYDWILNGGEKPEFVYLKENINFVLHIKQKSSIFVL